MRFLRALALACSGRQKLIAGEAFDGDESELSKILKGVRRPTGELIETVFLLGDPEPLLRWVELAAGVRFERVPRPWEEQLARAEEQIELVFETVQGIRDDVRQAAARKLVADERERERRGPIRVEPRRERDGGRRRA